MSVLRCKKKEDIHNTLAEIFPEFFVFSCETNGCTNDIKELDRSEKCYEAQLATLKAQLEEYKQVVRQVVEINIQRDDKGGYWCHECKSWNHRMDFDNRCTTKMLQDLLDREKP